MHTRIIGPPGTGKTTFIGQYLDDHMLDYQNPIVLSFSRSASQELIKRGYTSVTYHSFASSLASQNADSKKQFVSTLRRSFAIGLKPYISFFRSKGIHFSDIGPSLGSEVLRAYHSTMLRMAQHDYTISDSILEIDDTFVRSVIIDYIRYKSRIKMFDFDDLLLFALKNTDLFPTFDLVIEDESQDTNSIMNYLFHVMSKKARDTICVGDPNQTIFTFNGADPNLFTSRNVDKETILSKSHRVPNNLVGIANEVIDTAGLQTYDYDGTDLEGYFRIISTPFLSSALQLARKGTEVAILVRTNYNKRNIISKLNKVGVLPAMFSSESLNMDIYQRIEKTVKAIHYYLNGGSFKRMHTKFRGSLISTKRLVKYETGVYIHKDLRKAILMDLVKEVKAYRKIGMVKTVLDGAINERTQFLPNLVVDTIHKSKGRETDYVFLDVNYGGNVGINTTKKQYDRQEEARLLYVGITRAKRGVIIYRDAGRNDILSTIGLHWR